MKKAITGILAGCMVLSMAGCASDTATVPDTEVSKTTTSAVLTATSDSKSAEVTGSTTSGNGTTGSSGSGQSVTGGQTTGMVNLPPATTQAATRNPGGGQAGSPAKAPAGTTAAPAKPQQPNKPAATTTKKKPAKKTTTTAKKKTTTKAPSKNKYMTIKEIEDYGNNLLKQAGFKVDYSLKPGNSSWAEPLGFAIDDKAEQEAADNGLLICSFDEKEMKNQLNVEICCTLQSAGAVKRSANETNWMQNLVDGPEVRAQCRNRIYCELHPEEGRNIYWLYVLYT